MIVSILEGRVTSERWDAIEVAYRKLIKSIPHDIRENFIVQDVNDKTLWRIISIWQSKEAFDRHHDSEAIKDLMEVFRQVGVEPTQRIFRVVAQHMHV